jgi:N utilization substance protein A
MATRESPTAMFQRTLGMEPRIADALIAAGIETLEELAYVPINELLSIEALKDSEAQYFRQRAQEYLLRDVLDSDGDGDAIGA